MQLLLWSVVAIYVQFSSGKPAADTNNEVTAITDEILSFRSKYAEQMLSYMNLSVRPCDDFYEYACGNWKNVIKKRSTTKKRINFDDIEYKIANILEQMLERPNILDIAPELETEFQMAKQFYENCQISDLYPAPKSEYYLDMLKMFGSFPAVHSPWNSSKFSWLNMTAHLSNYGVDTMLEEKISTVYPYEPYFTLPAFGFDMELHNDTIRNKSSNAYQLNLKRMQSILTTYDVDNDRKETVIADVFRFLKSILDMMAHFDDKFEKCDELSDSINTEEVNMNFTPYYNVAWMGKIEELPRSYLPCLYYFQELYKICEEHKEAVANYLSLKFLYHMDSQLEDRVHQKEYCTFEIKRGFYFLFDHLYMKLHFDQEDADDIRSMKKMAQKSLMDIIQKSDWLDEESREAALLQVSSLEIIVGRYEDHKAIKILLDQLKNIKFTQGNFEANISELKKFQVLMKRYYRLHSEEIDSETKPIIALQSMEANAYFNVVANTIYIAAGAMLPPVYHKHWPQSLKWGTMGFILGHEMGHGRQIVEWSENSINALFEHMKCYIEHYSNYTIPMINRKINVDRTNEENMADANGVRVSYMSYRNYMDEEMKNEKKSQSQFEKEEQMPGIDLTSEQLLFLGGAQMFCSDYKEAHYWTSLHEDHTLEPYRVNGMFLNNKDFARVYQCSLGDNMNPLERKCFIW